MNPSSFVFVPRRGDLRRFAALLAVLMRALVPGLRAATTEVIYDDSLENGWENWSWATVDLSNAAPTHSGKDSIRVTAGAWAALYLRNGNAGQWNPTVFNTLVFWANGGTAGGQEVSLVGLTLNPTNSAADVPALTVDLPPLEANTWTEIQIPLSALGVADNPAFSAFWISNNTGSADPVFYVDDIRLTSDLAPTNPAPTNGVAMGPNDLVIFDGAFNDAAWEDWSWATSLNWNNPSPIESGTRSVAVQLGQYTAVAVHGCPPVSAVAYPNFIFWVDGGPQGGQTLTIQATINMPGAVPVNGVYEHSNVLQTAAVTVGPLPANTWRQEIVPLSALGVTDGQYLGDLWIWNTTDANQSEFYLDGMWLAATTSAPPATVANITVDAAAGRHPIDPRIYGTAYATAAQLTELGAPLNRRGGDTTSRYNWQLNADNKGNDWFFESWTDGSATAGDDADELIAGTQAAGAASLIAIPMLKWVANLGPGRSTLWSFSVAKYGAQNEADPSQPDAGNGVSAATGNFITGNDPSDANVPSSSAYQATWVEHLTNRWGSAASGGVSYYVMDNEPSIWYATHRDVQPKGVGMDEFLALFTEYASMIKSVDPAALIVGPEEWGWPGYFKSGLDQQNNNEDDQAAHGGQGYLPWLLGQLSQHDQGTGQRLIDVFSLHCYPQGGEFSNDTSPAMQLRRNRSTRSLWDTNYVDETWVCDCVQLIPRLKAWVASTYPGLQTAITEYNWGAETNINGATAQADILGIFGREGLDMATRWGVPVPGGLVYKACQMYRNYDGNHSGFGDVSVLAGGPNPDNVSVFAAQRSSDNALTVMVINKQLTNSAPLNLTLANFNPGGSAQAWRLTAANVISRLPDLAVNANALADSLPAQSITLYVVPAYVSATHPSLVLLAGPVNGRLQLEVGGVVGGTCVIEASPDLKTWTPVSTNILSAALAPVSVPAMGKAGFYRALMVH